MNKPGQICTSCQDRWSEKGMRPKMLELAPRPTQYKKLVVALCPFCDGPAYTQAQRSLARGQLPD